MLFRGIRATPLKISVRKKTIKRVLLAVVILAVVQVGVLAQYVSQTTRVTDQGAELEGLKAELSQSKEQAVGFSEAIDDMQERVLTIQTINEKLQVMFGLASEKAQDADAEGQGGEEVSYAAGGLGIRDGGLAHGRRNRRASRQRRGQDGGGHQREAGLARATHRAPTPHAGPVGKNSGRTGRPVGRDPIHLARQRPRVLKVRATHFTLYRKKGIPCGLGYQWPTRENRASPRQRQSGGGCL